MPNLPTFNAEESATYIRGMAHVASVRREAFGRRRASRKTSIEDRIRAIEAHLDDKTPGWRQQKFLLEGE